MLPPGSSEVLMFHSQGRPAYGHHALSPGGINCLLSDSLSPSIDNRRGRRDWKRRRMRVVVSAHTPFCEFLCST